MDTEYRIEMYLSFLKDWLSITDDQPEFLKDWQNAFLFLHFNQLAWH